MGKETVLLDLSLQQDWAAIERLLKDKGTKITDKQVNCAGRDGLTPLHHACLHVDEAGTEVVQRLLDAGADPTAVDGNGTTCLHIAASLAYVKLAKILINSELGADTNAPDNRGSTPLHFVAFRIPNDPDNDAFTDVQRCVKLLLEHGANPEKKDKDGKRPADVARADEVKKLLAGADADELGATTGTSRRRRRGNESSDDAPPPAGRTDEEEGQPGGRRRRRPGGVASAMEQVRSEVVSAVGNRTDQRRRRRQGAEGQQGDAALEVMLAQHEERKERRMAEQLAGQEDDVQWDLALELLPEHHLERGEREHELEGLEAGGRELLSPQLLVARVKAAHVGLQTRLIAGHAEGQLFLVVGAGLGRLAREAERIGMVAQLRPEIEKRMVLDKAAELGRDVTELSQSKYDDAELSEARGGKEAYAPYHRAVHSYFQMAAAPHFFACSQRTQLLSSILHAPRDVGGAGLSLAQLQRDKVLRKAFPLHDQDERKALEDRWGVEAALALAPAPLAQLSNYFGAEYTLYFAFLRTFSMWLWAPAMCGLVLFVFQESEYAGGESVWAAFYCILLLVWASGFLQHWKRTEASLEHQWGAPTSREANQLPEHGGLVERSGFGAKHRAAGFYAPIEDDFQFVPLEREAVPSGVAVPAAARFTARERALRQAASWAAYLVCIGLSVTLQTAVLLLRSSLQESMSPSISGGVIAALLNALVVELLGALYRPLVHALVGFQNYRSAVAHEYHYSVQLFVVLFANRFYSLFYLTMLKGVSGIFLFAPANDKVEEICRDRRGHASDDCMEELFVQIVALLAFDLLVKHVSKLGGILWTATKHRPPGRARVAHEATLPEGPLPAEDFSDLAMSFAMVVLFSGACPLAAGAALMSNAIEGRCDVYKFLRASRRYQSRAVADIGAWYSIFQVICYTGMLTNVVIICYTSTELPRLLTVPQVNGKLTDMRFVVFILLEHFFLFSKLMLDTLVPDVPSDAVETMALQRKLVALADEHATRDTVRLPGGTVKALVAADYDAEPPLRGELKPTDEDLDGEEPIAAHRRMSDLGLLRSFRPSTEEELGDLAHQLGHADRKRDRKKESTEKEVAAKQKAHKKWRKKLNWTPQRALEREGSSQDGLSSFSCTDAVWLFPVLVVWLVMLAAVVYAARLGQPSRLLYGVDYELNVCGVDNAAHMYTLRFSSQRAGTFPYEVLPATASVAGSVDGATSAALEARTLRTGERNLGPTDGRWWTAGRGSKSYLFYANPAARLPICVERCPTGIILGAAEHVCLYNHSALSYAAQEVARVTHCFPAYDTVAIAGYCVPKPPLKQAVYDAAGVGVVGEAGSGYVSGGAAGVRASDLQAIRDEVEASSAARYLDAAVGDLLISWEVLLGTLLGAVALGLLWVLVGGVLQLPTLVYGLSVLLTTGALCGLTYAFWVGGETGMADASQTGADFGATYHSAQTTAAVGYALCALTVVYLGLALALLRVVLPSLPLVQCACRLIGTAPGAIVGVLLSVFGQAGLLAFWFAGATYIGSSGLLEFNEHGFARLTYDSELKRMAVFHFLGGLWTSAIVAHLGKLMAANALGHAYWRAAERKLERGVPPPHHWLLCPLLHIGSVALGATASLLSPLLLPLQLVWPRTFDHYSEAGYIAVSLFGANLSEANRWASAITHGFVPAVLRMQAHCAIFTLVAKICVATSCACVAALVLAIDASFKDDISSLGLPVAIVFVVSYVLAATLLSLIDLAMAAAVQGWCLDYKQNCVDQRFKSSDTWMMAVELVDEAALLDLHEFLSSEREQEHQVEAARGRTARVPAPGRAPSRAAAAPQKETKKSKAQLRAEEEEADENARGRKKRGKPKEEVGAKGKQGKETDKGKDKKGELPAKGKSLVKGKKGRALSSEEEDDNDDYDDDGRERQAASPSARRRRPGTAAPDGGLPRKAASRERGGEVEEGATTSTCRGRGADS